jgi:hypothetical protein
LTELAFSAIMAATPSYSASAQGEEKMRFQVVLEPVRRVDTPSMSLRCIGNWRDSY